MTLRDPRLTRPYSSLSADALRASLLMSLGLTPLGCGGNVIGSPDGGSGASVGGSSSIAGSSSVGGSIGVAGAVLPIAGSAWGGATSQGGTTNGGAFTNGGAPSLAGASNGGSINFPVCANPKIDPVSQLITCANGLVHRARALTCTVSMGVGQGGEAGSGGSSELGDAGSTGVAIPQYCQTNAECASLHRGYCDIEYGGGPVAAICKSGCEQDSDCGSGVCVCDGVTPGRCVAAQCHTDAECGPKALCIEASQLCGARIFQCLRTIDDKCSTSADCDGSACITKNGQRECDDGPVCGRPFLVAELERIAPIAQRQDWLEAPLLPDFSSLSATQRAALAAHWARLGQLEHASIAAFARFNLQLLSLGAPASLIEDCNRAQADETAHTKLCFAFASRYGGTPVGPGKLRVQDCFDDMSLAGIAKLVLREGCVGETVAALEALGAAEAATDPAVKQALQRIARDEQAHAELAFRFLSWALTQSSPEVNAELALAAAECVDEFERAARERTSSVREQALERHGQLTAETLRAVHLSAVARVVRPLLAAVIG